MDEKKLKNKPIHQRKGLRIVKKRNKKVNDNIYNPETSAKKPIDKSEQNNTENFEYNANITNCWNDNIKEIYKKIKKPYYKYKINTSEYMFIRLTPKKYLDKVNLEFYKELVLSSFTKKENIQYKNFSLIHDFNNSFDDFAVNVSYDKFSLGLIRKNIDFYNYSDIVNTFIFDEKDEIKENLEIVIYEGKFILINEIEN